MRDIILGKLDEIEKRENVKIIYCAESGSRAWGFASPDSDYDVRFIYVRPREYYLRLDKTRDVIEWQLDETLDINGWDIKKVLSLLHKSNPTVFEWSVSPIVYKTTPEWEKIVEILPKYFSPKAGLYHYLNTAKSNYREHLRGDTVKLKKYFYVLRPLLSCRWILERGTPPSIVFDTLTEAYLDEGLKPAVARLIALKMKAPESEMGARVDAINDYLDRGIEEIGSILESLKTEVSPPWDELNEIFISLIN